MDPIKVLEQVKPGDKVTLFSKTIFNELVKDHAVYIGGLKQHGFMLPEGAWGLYGPGKPCHEAIFRFKGKRRKVKLKIPFHVVAIQKGWG